MKDERDNQTSELFPAPRRRGRPVTGQAKTAAERMKAYRARKKELGVLPQVSELIPELREQSFVMENSDLEHDSLRQALAVSEGRVTFLRGEVESLKAELDDIKDRHDFIVRAAESERARLNKEIGRLKAELSEQRKANGVLKGQVTTVKNRTALQVKVLRELVSWYTFTDEKGRVEGSHVPYLGEGIPRTNKEIVEKWVFAHDLLKS